MSQTARVLTGLIAGIALGIVLAWQAPDTGLQIAAIVEPFGKLRQDVGMLQGRNCQKDTKKKDN